MFPYEEKCKMVASDLAINGYHQQMITLKMADQRWSDIYVVLPRFFAVVTFVFGKLQS